MMLLRKSPLTSFTSNLTVGAPWAKLSQSHCKTPGVFCHSTHPSKVLPLGGNFCSSLETPELQSELNLLSWGSACLGELQRFQDQGLQQASASHRERHRVHTLVPPQQE